MRRRVGGVGAIQKQQLAQARFKDRGSELAEEQLQQMTRQMEAFRAKLQCFAASHKNDIRKNPQFRRQFQEMCATAGVDPLASSKGFWADMLGVGDFYYELGVQIIEVCLATSHRNGGLMSLEELRERVTKSRSSAHRQEEITQDDLLRAVEKLKTLGKGFQLISVGSRYLVQSVPTELSLDHTNVIKHAGSTGYVSVESLVQELGWDSDRAQKALEDLLKEGLVWLDAQAQKEYLYWFPGLIR
ncbi:vacuolar-sorting protein SNF8 [Amblyomma americanum]|uniref:Vacuolar-sorting protein SNF8 n=2 Tax=Amblyomma americanum TaxID=6943 RepID=A0AAQ4F130_AMBAM